MLRIYSFKSFQSSQSFKFGSPRIISNFILFLQFQNPQCSSLWNSQNPQFPVSCLSSRVLSPSILDLPELSQCSSCSCSSSSLSLPVFGTLCLSSSCFSQPLRFLPLYYFSCPLVVDACGHTYFLCVDWISSSSVFTVYLIWS